MFIIQSVVWSFINVKMFMFSYTVMVQAGLAPISWLTWFWTAWPRVSILHCPFPCMYVYDFGIGVFSACIFGLKLNFYFRSEGDWHCCYPGTRPWPETRDGAHQGTVINTTLCMYSISSMVDKFPNMTCIVSSDHNAHPQLKVGL